MLQVRLYEFLLKETSWRTAPPRVSGIISVYCHSFFQHTWTCSHTTLNVNVVVVQTAGEKYFNTVIKVLEIIDCFYWFAHTFKLKFVGLKS